MSDLIKEILSEILGRKIESIGDLSLGEIESVVNHMIPAYIRYTNS